VARPPRLADILPAYRPPLVRDRARLLAVIEQAWEELDGVVRGLDENALMGRVPGLGEGADSWAVKDVLVHLAAWKRNAAEIARRQADPRAPAVNGFPGQVLGFKTDQFNARLMAGSRDRAAGDALVEHRAAHRELLAALQEVPEHRLLRRGRSVLWLTPAIGHPAVHLVDLRRALATAQGAAGS
jgi:hypothetical protein